MTQPKFRRNQRWKTRDGRLAVIDTVRGSDSRFPIQGRVRAYDDTWYQRAWTADGMTVLEGCCVADHDLIAPWPTERKPREWTMRWDDKLGCVTVWPPLDLNDHIKVREILE